MKIVFDKVGATAKPVSLEVDGIRLEGTLQKSGYHQVLLEGELSGEISLACDRCGTDYTQRVDTPLKLSLRDTLSEDKDDLDIIEFLDGVIDVAYIIESEINAIEGSFHYCSGCEGSEEIFEIEY